MIPCEVCGKDTADTGEPCDECMNPSFIKPDFGSRPDDEYFAYIKSDAYITYLNRN